MWTDNSIQVKLFHLISSPILLHQGLLAQFQLVWPMTIWVASDSQSAPCHLGRICKKPLRPEIGHLAHTQVTRPSSFYNLPSVG
jgi:hypothetical protein